MIIYITELVKKKPSLKKKYKAIIRNHPEIFSTFKTWKQASKYFKTTVSKLIDKVYKQIITKEYFVTYQSLQKLARNGDIFAQILENDIAEYNLKEHGRVTKKKKKIAKKNKKSYITVKQCYKIGDKVALNMSTTFKEEIIDFKGTTKSELDLPEGATGEIIKILPKEGAYDYEIKMDAGDYVVPVSKKQIKKLMKKRNPKKKETKIQYWKDGVMMGLVSGEDAKEIMRNAKNAGFEVKDFGDYFTIGSSDKIVRKNTTYTVRCLDCGNIQKWDDRKEFKCDKCGSKYYVEREFEKATKKTGKRLGRGKGKGPIGIPQKSRNPNPYTPSPMSQKEELNISKGVIPKYEQKIEKLIKELGHYPKKGEVYYGTIKQLERWIRANEKMIKKLTKKWKVVLIDKGKQVDKIIELGPEPNIEDVKQQLKRMGDVGGEIVSIREVSKNPNKIAYEIVDRLYECEQCGKQEIHGTNHKGQIYPYCSYCVGISRWNYIRDIDWEKDEGISSTLAPGDSDKLGEWYGKHSKKSIRNPKKFWYKVNKEDKHRFNQINPPLAPKTLETIYGWGRRKPQLQSERRKVAGKYGRSCFLDTKGLRFPICDRTGHLDCDGLKSAYARAKQFGYESWANKSLNKAKKLGCRWTERHKRNPYPGKGKRLRVGDKVIVLYGDSKGDIGIVIEKRIDRIGDVMMCTIGLGVGEYRRNEKYPINMLRKIS